MEEIIKEKLRQTVLSKDLIVKGYDQDVWIVQTDKEKIVVKIPREDPQKIQNEVFGIAHALSKMPVPQVLYYDDSILIEEYIEGEDLSDCKQVPLSLYEQAGKYLKQFHSVTLEGYGPIRGGKGIFTTYRDYVTGWFIGHFEELKEHLDSKLY